MRVPRYAPMAASALLYGAGRPAGSEGASASASSSTCSSSAEQVGATEGVRWKGYPCTLLHAAAFRVAKTP